MVQKRVDHLVYAVRNLEESMDYFEAAVGVRPVIGGRHQTFGTKNALVKLDKGMYLEILAIDEENSKIAPPRWMGVDLLTKNQITRWAVTSTDLKRDSALLEVYKTGLGKITNGARNTPDGKILQWKLTVPMDQPEVELVPFCIDWSNDYS